MLIGFCHREIVISQIEDAALEMYDSIIRADNIAVNMEVASEPQSLGDYLETWRMRIWDHAYAGAFKGPDGFKKSMEFKDYKGSSAVVKRVIYKYNVVYFLIICCSLSVHRNPAPIIDKRLLFW